ncbi:type II toxin-antitoxin system HipA family toxin [Afipia sp. TerB]|jgi:serine/threonine-protein kinase HipA|nr:type II toxin-antitoxin system HipA family toxin [Hyphomicrobiales bacterium]
MSEIEVHIELNGVVHRVGTLRVQARNGRTAVSFEYHRDWLALSAHFSLEPAMKAGAGVFTPDRGREMFVSIGDSAPDTWGRRLMQRMERRSAKAEGRAVRTLTEADYLLGVADISRLGALRFCLSGEQEFQAPHAAGIPPFIQLGRLLSVTERVLRDEETDEDLLLLFAPGSSLGGARPKASVADKDGHLAIAKFPKQDDDYRIETWEEVALTLADAAGIRTAPHRIEQAAGKAVFVSRRFDRTTDGKRLPFLSAMAMLGFKDGEHGSYPELVDALRTYGSDTESDAIELFRRMVFNILASNVDDHMRNHGFLWAGELGWKLSPAYDLNPVPADVRARVLSTNITLDEATCSIDLARQAATDFFALPVKQADEIIGQVALAVSTWREVAARKGVKKSEIERMASAFDHDELRNALKFRGGPVAGADIEIAEQSSAGPAL